jgi:hypothetical protein
VHVVSAIAAPATHLVATITAPVAHVVSAAQSVTATLPGLVTTATRTLTQAAAPVTGLATKMLVPATPTSANQSPARTSLGRSSVAGAKGSRPTATGGQRSAPVASETPVAHTAAQLPGATRSPGAAGSGSTRPIAAGGTARSSRSGSAGPVLVSLHPTPVTSELQASFSRLVVGSWAGARPGMLSRTSGPARNFMSRPAVRAGDEAPTHTPEPMASPAGPVAPVPGVPMGVGGASGGSAFFFFVAALSALAGLLVSGVIVTLRTTVGVAPPQPFLCLLERPG